MILDRFFKLKENNTSVRVEVLGGVTTFLTMAYILAVNPRMLSAAGMDATAVLIATALASFTGTMIMALLANYPFALAPGMGMNAFFAFTVCGSMGFSWQFALTAVFAEGIIYIIFSLTGIREAIFNAIPYSMKKAVGAGIGLFIAFIGFQGAHLVVRNDSTLVSYVKFSENFHTEGISALLALIGLFITAILYINNVLGSFLIGIIVTWVLGMIAQATGLYIVSPEAGYYSLFPQLGMTDFSAVGSTFGQMFSIDYGNFDISGFVIILLSMIFMDLFDTLGSLIGVASKAGVLDENGNLPRVRRALMADSIATCVGSLFGTSATTTFVECTAGVEAGARTGLASVVTGLLFLLSVFLAPVFTAVPAFATAPALIFVGVLMLSSVVGLDISDLTETAPAFLCILTMPLMYSICEGIAIGVISYVAINFCCNKRNKITPLMYILAVLFILKYIFL